MLHKRSFRWLDFVLAHLLRESKSNKDKAVSGDDFIPHDRLKISTCWLKNAATCGRAAMIVILMQVQWCREVAESLGMTSSGIICSGRIFFSPRFEITVAWLSWDCATHEVSFVLRERSLFVSPLSIECSFRWCYLTTIAWRSCNPKDCVILLKCFHDLSPNGSYFPKNTSSPKKLLFCFTGSGSWSNSDHHLCLSNGMAIPWESRLSVSFFFSFSEELVKIFLT